MIERQVIVTWHTMAEPKPKAGLIVPVTVSGRFGQVTYDHAMVMADWLEEDDGWYFHDSLLEAHRWGVTVHAWADLEPYGGQ